MASPYGSTEVSSFPLAYDSPLLGTVNMNDLSNLRIYDRLFLFRKELSEEDVQWHNPDSLRQRILQAIAHHLGLAYEFSLATRIARISRPAPPEFSMSGDFDFMDLDQIDGLSETIPRMTDDPDAICTPMEMSITHSQPDPSFAPSSRSQPPGQSTNDENYSEWFNWDLAISGADQDQGYVPVEMADQSFNPLVNPSLPISSLPGQEQDTFHNPTSTTHSKAPSDSPHPAIAYPVSPLHHPVQPNLDTPSSLHWNEAFQLGGASNPSPLHSNAPSFIPRQASRSPVSVNSIQSDRDRNGLNKLSSRKSTNSGTSSGYQEIIFDSKSVHSGSRTSASSVRRRPMNDFARRAMKAVKSVGACWRCKYLRKSCDPQSPCDLCPEKSGSNWEAVGCKRGPIKSRMVPIALCPINDIFRDHPISSTGETISVRLYAQICLRKAIERREIELACVGISLTNYDTENITSLPASKVLSIEHLTSNWRALSIIDCFPDSRYSSLKANLPIPLVPLNECLLGIIWEFLDRPSNCTILNADGTLQSFMPLLRSVVLYQAKIETDRLIAQSLICLRSCLEAMRVKAAGFLKDPAHGFCAPSSCKIECISNLDMHLTLYLDELSRVFFKKENMRNKKSCWLSIFYSFCIQSTVRKALIALENDAATSNNTDGGSLVRKQYLHLPVRLFIASSGPYDPLITRVSSSSSSAERDGPSVLDCEAACIAVNQAGWKPRGIRCSGDYLKELFEDAGDILP